jgi:hypothetical protein
MTASDAIRRAFRLCSHKVGTFSMILMPVFFASTFVTMGGVALSGAGSGTATLIALDVAAFMLVTTWMLLAQSRDDKARGEGRVVAMPLRVLRDKRAQAGVESRPCAIAPETCDLCRGGSLKLRCLAGRVKRNDAAFQHEYAALAALPRAHIRRQSDKPSPLSMQSDVSYNRLRKSIFNRGTC